MYVVQNCIILLRKVPRVFILRSIERNISCKVVFLQLRKNILYYVTEEYLYIVQVILTSKN